MNTLIITAAHKECDLKADNIHLPLHVGAALSKNDIGFKRDDSGDNISKLNPWFSELTGLYWAWRNIDADFIGLEHYRRRFKLPKNWNPKKETCYLPAKRHYVIESLYSHYSHTHNELHLVETEIIIKELCPKYFTAFKDATGRTSGYMFNMLIMPKQMLNDYASWLFPILFELNERVDSSKYSDFDKRFVGRIGEILLNVWIEKNNPEKIELPITETGITWNKKIIKFLKAKFSKIQYESNC